MKVDHAIVLQEKYENLHVLTRVHITMRAFRVLRLRQKSALKHLHGFGSAYQMLGNSLALHGNFPFWG